MHIAKSKDIVRTVLPVEQLKDSWKTYREGNCSIGEDVKAGVPSIVDHQSFKATLDEGNQ